MIRLETVIFAAFVILEVVAAADDFSDWSYHSEYGIPPEQWPMNYSQCGGTRQSPIDIVTADTKAEDLSAVRVTGYNTSATFTVKNNGHSVVVTPSAGFTATISGGGLGKTFTFAQFHIHWGEANANGSEHRINGHAYSAEVHFVHANGDDLAVLGVFLEIGDEENAAFQVLVDRLDAVKYRGDETTMSLTLGTLLSGSEAFFRYNGSLTTPTCDETVTWTVFSTPIKVSGGQIAALRQLYIGTVNDTVGQLHDNFRHTQPLNGRMVLRYEPTTDTATIATMSTMMMTIVMATAFLAY